MRRTPKVHQTGIVLVGHFNPLIFRPGWFSRDNSPGLDALLFPSLASDDVTGAEPPAQTHQIRASFGVGAEHLASEPTDANVPGEGARRPATLEQSQSRLPVQSFPVITPLCDEGR